MQPSSSVTVDAVKGNESGNKTLYQNSDVDASTSRNYNQRNIINNNLNQNFNSNRRFSYRGRGFVNNRYKNLNETAYNFLCLNCNQSHNSRSCPAFGKKCSNYFKFNHFAVAFNAKNVKLITFNNYNSDEDEIDQMFVHSIHEFKNYKDSFKDLNCSRKYWKESLKINDTFVEFKWILVLVLVEPQLFL